ncbi:duf1680 domain-containing protein [Pseudomassariella vexata]|uniref:Duf1680 domain-containing protein n=1 Tax=Pseudomassariella vexata TaxID=1141098 RepID=A0A1Y2EAB7_9PEZI|nr:duf1680 domain-containing protein [Pseudomassariella vexata]ORY68337.1 duf1680 domain-containing protein [Pseudomassariella vexata]
MKLSSRGIWVAMRSYTVLKLIVAPALAGRQFMSEQKVMQAAAEDDKTLAQPIFGALPLGSISPLGWMRDQLELEAAGLAGNMFDFYRFVHDARWIGGATEYSGLDEASPYWFNGIVPLAFGLNDSRIIGQVKHYLDYVIDHQASDGWLGFEETHQTRGIWARCLLLLGMMQYAEADSTQTERIVDSMHRFVVLAHSMLQDNYTGLIVHGDDTFDIAGFGMGRTHELHIPLQWLYEKYPRNNSQILWETMELMIDGGEVWGADWRKFWVEDVYPKSEDDVNSFDGSWVFLHGVNHAEGLRYPLSIYRMTHDEALKRQTRTAVDLVDTYHKSLAGSIIGDEYISDKQPQRGAELCIAPEVMFSLAYIYQYLGDNDIADWVEQTTFNAFPASVSSDWWSHQYVQQENQPWARNLTKGSSGLWVDVNSYSNVFGLEPNYPCCTVNHPQAYPKYLANSFVTTEDGGIAHVLLGPASLSATLGGDNAVLISTDTKYPFDLSLTYTITATSAFDFYVRTPTWANTNTSTITGPGKSPQQAITLASNGLQKVSIPANEETKFIINLDTQPRVELLPNNAAAIYHGALLYSFAIEFNTTEHAPLRYYDEALLDSSTTDGHTHDHAIVPTSPWAIAIDPSQIAVVPSDSTNGDALPNPIWALGAPPVELRVAAVEIDWPLEHDTPAVPPTNPVVTGTPFSARFVPYGSAKLHMAHLPVLSLDTVDLLG